MHLGRVGQLPDAFGRRLRQRFPDVDIADDDELDALLFWGRPIERVADIFLENLDRFRRGEALLNVVDLEEGY